MNSNITLAELQKSVWVMEYEHLENTCRQIAEITLSKDIFNDQTFTLTDQDRLLALENDESASLYTVRGSTAIIPIVGLLMKEVPRVYKFLEEYFAIHTTGYDKIRAAIQEAVGDETVENILLHIDSPGGMVSGVQEVADAIFNARSEKKVIAYIEDMGASGAYWLASQAEKVYSNKNARVGGIGVYTVYMDWSKAAEEEGLKVNIIRSGEHKGMGEPGAPITKEQIASVKKYVTGLGNNFVSDIARGRNMKTADVREYATGETWIAQTALSNGLIDGIMDLSEVMTTGFNSDVLVLEGDDSMTDEKEKKEQADALEAARKEAEAKANADEGTRVAAINEAFPDDAEFAMKAVTEGMGVDQAKAAYADVLAIRNKTLAADNVKLKEEAAAAAAAAPVPPEGNEGLDFDDNTDANAGSGDFMAMSKDLVAEGKCKTMKEAMKKVNKENPGLHKAWFDNQPHAAREKEGTRVPKE